MNTQKYLKILNPFFALAFLTAALAILIARFAPQLISNSGSTVYEIHETAGLIFIGLAVLHITLNWTWIKVNIFGFKPKTKVIPIIKK